MAQTKVRIRESALEALRELARDEHDSIQAVLERAVEAYRRKRFIERVNDGYAALRADPRASQAHQSTVRWLESTVADGLDDEVWTDDGHAVPRDTR